MLDLPYKRLSGTAIGPTRAYDRDAAYDLYADHDGAVGAISTVLNTNVAVAIPEGYGGLLMGRSSLAKESIHPLGFVVEGPEGELRLGGVIDSGYRGGLKIMLASVAPGGPWREIKRGEAIAQIWILPVPETEPFDVGDGELPPSVRGERWNGSSNGRNRGPSGSALPFGSGSKAREEFEALYQGNAVVPGHEHGTTVKSPDPRTKSEEFQSVRKSVAERKYGVPCVYNEGTGIWEPGLPPVETGDPFAGIEGGVELRLEWERKGRPALPRYGSPQSEIIAALRDAPEPAQGPAEIDPADPPVGTDEAPKGLLDALDRAIAGTAREVAEAILHIPRPAVPGSPYDDYGDAVAALVEDRFRKNFKLSVINLVGMSDHAMRHAPGK